MNAYKFIGVNGLEKAKSYFNFGKPFSLDKITLESGAFIIADDLRQAIADFEIVEVHGFEKSKEILANAPADAECYSWTLGNSGIRDKTVVLKDLKQAIERIEQGLKS